MLSLRHGTGIPRVRIPDTAPVPAVPAPASITGTHRTRNTVGTAEVGGYLVHPRGTTYLARARRASIDAIVTPARCWWYLVGRRRRKHIRTHQLTRPYCFRTGRCEWGGGERREAAKTRTDASTDTSVPCSNGEVWMGQRREAVIPCERARCTFVRYLVSKLEEKKKKKNLPRPGGGRTTLLAVFPPFLRSW